MLEHVFGGIFSHFDVFLGIFGHFAILLGGFDYFRVYLVHLWFGAFWGTATSRWCLLSLSPPTETAPMTIATSTLPTA